MEKTTCPQAADRTGSLIAQIYSAYPELRPSERSVADIVVQDIGRAIGASSMQLAVWANVSESTISRFCRAVGCSSLKEFQSRLSES